MVNGVALAGGYIDQQWDTLDGKEVHTDHHGQAEYQGTVYCRRHWRREILYFLSQVTRHHITKLSQTFYIAKYIKITEKQQRKRFTLSIITYELQRQNLAQDIRAYCRPIILFCAWVKMSSQIISICTSGVSCSVPEPGWVIKVFLQHHMAQPLANILSTASDSQPCTSKVSTYSSPHPQVSVPNLSITQLPTNLTLGGNHHTLRITSVSWPTSPNATQGLSYVL